MKRNASDLLTKAADRLRGYSFEDAKPASMKMEVGPGITVTIENEPVGIKGVASYYERIIAGRRYNTNPCAEVEESPNYERKAMVSHGVAGRVGSLVVEGPKELVTEQLGAKVGELIKAERDRLRTEEATARLEAELAAEAERRCLRPYRERALGALSTWEFKQSFRKALNGLRTELVGQCYRDEAAQRTLASKGVYNMALLVPEPDNAHDSNAIMVFAWSHKEKRWHHVGYVPERDACLMRSRWANDFRNVAVATFTDIPEGATGHRKDPRIKLQLTGEMRSYPNYQ